MEKNSMKPSMDTWLAEAKAHESSKHIGMYLTHNGVVRETSRAQVREGAEGTLPVLAMEFGYDAEKVTAAVADAIALENAMTAYYGCTLLHSADGVFELN